MLRQNEGIDRGRVEEEPEQVFVKFPGLRSDFVVASQLVSLIDACHVPVVGDDARWTRDHLTATILLLPLYLSVSSWWAVG